MGLSNVVHFDPQVESEVQILEKLLGYAREGKLQSIAMVGVLVEPTEDPEIRCESLLQWLSKGCYDSYFTTLGQIDCMSQELHRNYRIINGFDE